MENHGNIELIGSMKQRVWGWPVVANAIFGGLAAGLYVILFFMRAFVADADEGLNYHILGMVSPLMMGLGFLALAFEAGRPMKGYYLVRNLRSSWMSAEVLAGTVFILSAVADFFYPHIFAKGIAAVAAGGFIVCQGLIFYRARAITSWNVSTIPVLFIISSLFMGTGFLLVFAGIAHFNVGRIFLFVAMALAGFDLALWIKYISWNRGPAFRRSTEALRRPLDIGIAVGVGHLLPVLMLSVLFLLSPGEKGISVQHVMTFSCGLSILAGGICQKISVILNTDYLRGITIGQPDYCVTSAGTVQKK